MRKSKVMNDRSKTVLVVSRMFLAAVWISSLASIPNFRAYQDQMSSGVAIKDIVAPYASVSVFVTITSIGAWAYTSVWLRQAVDKANLNVPGTVRLSRGWAMWGWIVPIVSLWFPRMIVNDLLKSTAVADTESEINVNTWWMTWIMYSLLNSASAVYAFTDMYSSKSPINPIHPEMEIAGACLLTASYFVWTKIVTKLANTY